MKNNTNDIIFSVVAIVLFGIVAAVSFFTRREPVAPAAPAPVSTQLPPIPASDVVLADNLPGSGNQNGQGGGLGARGGAPQVMSGGGGQPRASQGGPPAANGLQGVGNAAGG